MFLLLSDVFQGVNECPHLLQIGDFSALLLNVFLQFSTHSHCICFVFLSFSPDSRVWQSLSGHEWDHPPVFPPEWRGRSLSHFWGKDFCWHLPLPGSALQDHQASQGLLHGGGWRRTKGKDEPAEGTQVQVGMDNLSSLFVYWLTLTMGQLRSSDLAPDQSVMLVCLSGYVMEGLRHIPVLNGTWD